ncbi:hypothetical protein XJ28_21205 [Pseudomonas syringae pv. tomato]|nr:hypothetical protein XJ28_21205 [Pseudomonas syringae pv. tomato]KGK94206.1 hypothetical protein NB04_17060 [Pseudomonas syringae pv. tomato]QBI62193.1 hypothetical protein EIZ61_12270 [Pseudomonas syringae]TES63986.1 hypothetical protein E2N90_25345 [Pseudomonas syringae pv. tomato]
MISTWLLKSLPSGQEKGGRYSIIHKSFFQSLERWKFVYITSQHIIRTIGLASKLLKENPVENGRHRPIAT